VVVLILAILQHLLTMLEVMHANYFFIFLIFILTLPFFAFFFPRILIDQYFELSNHKKDPFLFYAYQTNRKWYALELGSTNTGVSIKNITYKKSNEECGRDDPNVTLVILRIHGWFGVPYKDITEYNCIK
jgi:hypothetical protein